MRGIVQVTNWEGRPVTDGGTLREHALARFLDERGAARILVQSDSFRRSKACRIARLPALLKEIQASRPQLVVLSYPSYPFFWQYRTTPYTAMSFAFAALLRRSARASGFGIVIDVMDLPVYQYRDLGFELEMRPSTLHRFDRFVFSRADVLWVCSQMLAKLIHTRYGIEEARLVVALNGYHTELPPSLGRSPGTVRFAYAGSLNAERGILPVIQALTRGSADCQLHLCGAGGDWIRSHGSDPRIVYHGSLSDEQAARKLRECDVGLIPYPEQGYYHLAFATKLPFYLGLGLPVLCSNAAETASHVERLGVGICRPIADFGAAFADIAADPAQIVPWQKRVAKVRRELRWSSIYGKALEQTLASYDESGERRAA